MLFVAIMHMEQKDGFRHLKECVRDLHALQLKLYPVVTSLEKVGYSSLFLLPNFYPYVTLCYINLVYLICDLYFFIICSYLSLWYSLFSAILSLEGKKSVMHLAHRMVKTFCRTLDVSDCENFPYLTRMMNNGEVTIIVRKNNSEQDVPQGLILSAATSFLLPHSPENVFDFLIDNKKRAKVQNPKL